jgi:hypothetical protein
MLRAQSSVLSWEGNMTPRTRFLVIGFVSGVVAVIAVQRAQDHIRVQRQVVAPAARSDMSFHKNEDFEAIERGLRGSRDKDWNPLQDMQPCFPGSKLCFLLSGPASERRS